MEVFRLAQFAPAESHRCHRYAKDVGEFVHVPFEAVRVLPTVVVPEIDGGVVFVGALVPPPPPPSVPPPKSSIVLV